MASPSPTQPGTELRSSETTILTKAEAARFLGIRPRTLDEWRAAKAIPCIVRGRYVRFLKSDLVAFLERHRLEAKPAAPRRSRTASSAA